MSNEEIIKRVNAWQDAGFVHPLTCIGSSKHPNLIPIEKDGRVILQCPKCKRVQLNIPPSIIECDPELIASEKERLTKLGFKFLI